MLLVIDVGNTNISFGVFGGKLLHHVRCESARARTADEYAVLVRQMLALRGVDLERHRQRHRRERRPHAHRHDGRVRPPRVRARGDRGRARHQDRDGHPLREPARGRRRPHRQRGRGYEWAGARHRRRLRHRDHLRLRDAQGRVPGRRHHARRADQRRGALLARGAPAPRRARAPAARRRPQPRPLDAVGHRLRLRRPRRGPRRRIKKELGYPCRVIATGGLARLIAPQTEAIELVDDDLTLTGLRLIFERNEQPASKAPPPPGAGADA